ncbi:MAG: tetraacyldisaccharide 4'-kinase [Smithellaceae bacterium]|nr:tetraacyldisaccharide 4'-kinase [Smithellaceae bacterium]
MRKILARIWSGEDQGSNRPLVLLLGLLSFGYRSVVSLRNFLFDRGLLKVAKLSCPVISVGNITVGGTGKTPMVINLARHFQQNGFSPAVLTRGYGGRGLSGVTLVSDGKETLNDYQAVGEEAVLLARSLPGVPVLVGPKRARTGLVAREIFRADLVILDDAFQHRGIFRDLNLVLLNSSRPLGNGQLLPAGPLREPASALKRADIVVYTGVADKAEEPVDSPVALFPAGTPVFRACYQPKDLFHPPSGRFLPPGILRGKTVCLLAGIGRPEGFQETVASLGAKVAAYRIFPDHHIYRPGDLDDLLPLCEENKVDFLITTEKDAVKLVDYRESIPDWHILRIELAIIPDQAAFYSFLASRLRKKSEITESES